MEASVLTKFSVHKFWIKFLMNFDWTILNKILIEFKFVGHLRKILKTLDYFLVKFELIPRIEVKYASKKIGKF